MIFLFVFSCSVVGQTISPEQKQILIDKIINGDDNQALEAIIEIRMKNLNDCAQVVFSNLWKHDPVVRLNFLKALYEFEYPDIHNLALAYIDSLRHYKYSEEDISETELKSSINTVLFNLNDFSKKQFVFDYIQTISPDLNREDIYLLEKILEHYPSDSEIIKTILINTACNSDDHLIRWIAISVLDDHYGQQVLSVAMQLAANDTVDTNRGLIIEEIVGRYNNSTVHSFLSTQLSRETFGQNINTISEILFSQYGTPTDYLSVKNIQPTLNDTLYKSYIKIVLLDDFHAIQPGSNTAVNIMLDTLNSYSQKCYAYTWLGDSNFLSQLLTLLDDTKTILISGDSLGAALKIKQYQSSIVRAKKDSLANRFVTEDGYKFLYYYPKYILERLPKLPTIGNITPSITTTKTKEFTLSVNGNSFTPISVIYFSGAPRKTTFVSGTLLKTDFYKKDTEKEGVYKVWIANDGGIASDTLNFNIYKKLPMEVRPELNCIDEIGKEKYRAWFGYENKNDGSVWLDQESENKFDPAPQDRGQPTIFLPGKYDRVFSVEFEGNKKLMWKLDKEKAEASKNSPRCN